MPILHDADLLLRQLIAMRFTVHAAERSEGRSRRWKRAHTCREYEYRDVLSKTKKTQHSTAYSKQHGIQHNIQDSSTQHKAHGTQHHTAYRTSHSTAHIQHAVHCTTPPAKQPAQTAHSTRYLAHTTEYTEHTTTNSKRHTQQHTTHNT